MKRILKNVHKQCVTALGFISPKLGVTYQFSRKFGRKPNLSNPQDFAEKITWLKIFRYASDNTISNLADKYEVRDYVNKKGYSHILNDLYGVYSSIDEFNIDELPERFALKGTHGCGFNIIVDSKQELDYITTRNTVKKWLGKRFGYNSIEPHYTKIKPRVIAEKNLSNDQGNVPLEYKIFCFNGEVGAIQVSPNPEEGSKRNYFDTEWNELFYGKDAFRYHTPANTPPKLNSMLSIARDLSKGFPFVRIDLYASEEKIIFGEMTFSPAAGYPVALSDTGLYELGKRLTINTSS